MRRPWPLWAQAAAVLLVAYTSYILVTACVNAVTP